MMTSRIAVPASTGVLACMYSGYLWYLQSSGESVNSGAWWFGNTVIGLTGIIVTGVWECRVRSRKTKNDQLEETRKANEDQEKEAIRDGIRSALSNLSSEADEMLERLVTAYRSSMDGVTQSRADSPRSIVEQDIERWIKETPAKLDELRVGWGARFKSIDVPTRQQNDIGGGRHHESAGKLHMHKGKLAELLAGLDK